MNYLFCDRFHFVIFSCLVFLVILAEKIYFLKCLTKKIGGIVVANADES